MKKFSKLMSSTLFNELIREDNASQILYYMADAYRKAAMRPRETDDPVAVAYYGEVYKIMTRFSDMLVDFEKNFK